VKQVAVVILNWNGENHLRNFLPEVIQHSAPHADVWVIDNASTDDSVALLKKEFPEVHLVQLKENFGFAGGYNKGLAQIKSDLFVLLNTDVQVTPNWIPPVLEFMELQDLAACQPKILNYNNKEWFEYAGASGGFIDRDGFIFCAGRIFDSFEQDHGQYNKDKEVFWASGACLFIRSELYFKVGGFDQDFFAHMEEIDLCWRLKNRGYRIGASGKSHVYHVGGGTLHKYNPFKTYLNFRNNLFLLTKNYHHRPFVPLLFRRLFLDGLAAFRFIIEGNWNYFKAVLKAHVSFYFSFRKTLKKRKIEHRALQSPNLTGWYTKSVIFDYYLNKKHSFQELDSDDFKQS
jgi:GT2 family glycosyltransferase